MDWERNDYILVIEEGDAAGADLAEVLQDKGHRVVTCGDGRLALDYLRQKSILPRLIFLDLAAPKQYGREFLAERRKDARISTVPVVGLGDIDSAGEAPVSSSIEMLQKPVSRDQLLGLVERWGIEA